MTLADIQGESISYWPYFDDCSNMHSGCFLFSFHTRRKEEEYRHLSLDIGEVDPRTAHFSIQQGVERFFCTEKIDVKCEQCQEGLVATQSMKIISRYVIFRPCLIYSKRNELMNLVHLA